MGSFLHLFFYARARATSLVRKQAIWVELRRAVVAVSEESGGAASVIGNLLALARALRVRSAVVSSMCQDGRAGLRIRLVGRLIDCL